MELLTEEEQWERLKLWLRTNGPSIVGMVIVALLGWYGLKWWQERGARQADAAGTTYERILEAFDEEMQPEGLALIEELRREYPKSPYVAGADLIAARVFVENNELDRAVERLERVMNAAPDENVRPIARVRLARVFAAQAQYDRALDTLGTADMGVHESARLEARGDVFYAQGDHVTALREYEAARLRLPEEQASAVGELLDLKIADLRDNAAAVAGPEAEATP